MIPFTLLPLVGSRGGLLLGVAFDVELLLEGPVEANEAYIGGKETNKHASKKLNAGRGTVGKIPVTGLKDRATKEVRAQVTQPVNRANVKGFVEENMTLESMLYTDESSIYEGMSNHEAV